MTVSTTTNKDTYTGNGATTDFPTTFPFYNETDLEVVERVIATGVESVLVLNTDYTVAGGAGTTGTVTAASPPAATVQWVIRRVLPKTQEIDYVENDPFPAETHEEGLDRAAMRNIDLQEEVDRAPKFPVTDPDSSIGDYPNSVQRAGKAATYDSAGKPTATAFADLSLDFDITISGGDAGLPVVANATEDGLEFPANAGAHRTAIGAAGLEDANLFAALQKLSKGADVASANPLVLGADGNFFDVTGTTGFASITVAAGALFVLQFDGILTITHGASLLLPGAANITTAAGDRALCYATAANTVIVVAYTRAAGTAVVPASGPASVQVFTSSGTWTRPSGVKRVLIEVVGGGGGGGGSAGASASTNAAAGGGGGGTAKKIIDVSAIASSTITVGAAGAAGASGANTGGTGGTSSWDDGTNTVSATGGGGGQGQADGATAGAQGGVGGDGSGGDINIRGGAGGSGGNGASDSVTSGAGGSSTVGGGAPGVGTASSGAAGTAAAANSGGGGSGGRSGSAQAGGAGGSGIIIVWEYD